MKTKKLKKAKPPITGRCRCCRCTEYDCSGCVDRTGGPCSWADGTITLCTACVCAKCGLDSQGRVTFVRPRVGTTSPAEYAKNVVQWCSKCRQANAGKYRRDC